MNNQSPLVPQGSLEPKNTGRARVKIFVFFVLAVHGIGLLALLMQGCHKEEPVVQNQVTNAPPAFEAPQPTNAPPEAAAAVPSNPPPAAVDNTPPAPIPAAATALTDYKVLAGDNPSKIAANFKVPLKALLEANPGLEPTKLKPGQTIHIPPAPAPAATAALGATGAALATAMVAGGTDNVYSVKSGDNLTTIAKNFGVSVRSLRAANPNLTTDSIKVGQKLHIPAKATAAATPTADPAATPPQR